MIMMIYNSDNSVGFNQFKLLLNESLKDISGNNNQNQNENNNIKYYIETKESGLSNIISIFMEFFNLLSLLSA